jgi:hypothetical protein
MAQRLGGHGWSDAARSWDGFAPTAHTLDSKCVLELPLKQMLMTPDGRKEWVSTNLMGVLLEFANRSLKTTSDMDVNDLL